MRQQAWRGMRHTTGGGAGARGDADVYGMVPCQALKPAVSHQDMNKTVLARGAPGSIPRRPTPYAASARKPDGRQQDCMATCQCVGQSPSRR